MDSSQPWPKRRGIIVIWGENNQHLRTEMRVCIIEDHGLGGGNYLRTAEDKVDTNLINSAG